MKRAAQRVSGGAAQDPLEFAAVERSAGWAVFAHPETQTAPTPLWLALAGLGAGVAFGHLASVSSGGIEQLALLTGAAASGGLGFYGLAERVASRGRAGRIDVRAAFRSAYDRAPDCMALVDAAGRVMALNAAARAEMAEGASTVRDLTAEALRRGGRAAQGDPPAARAAAVASAAALERTADAAAYRMLRAALHGETAIESLTAADGSELEASAWPGPDGLALWRWRAVGAASPSAGDAGRARIGRRAGDRAASGVALLADGALDARSLDSAPGIALRSGPQGETRDAVAAGLGWARFDLDGGSLEIDATLRRWLGGPDAAPRSLGDLFPEAHRRVLEAARSGRSGAFRVRLAAADAESGAKTASALVAPDGAERAVVVVADAGPETRGNLAEVASGLGLTLSADRLLGAFDALQSVRLFEDSPIGVAALAPDGRLLRLNAAGVRLLTGEDAAAASAGAAALAGRPLSGWLAPEQRAGAVARIAAAAQGELVDGPSFEATLSGEAAPKAGAEADEPRTVEVYLSRIETAKGALLLAYLIDTSERRALEERIHQSQKMQAVGQLAGGVAHDFNNLLTVIIGSAEMLLQRHAADDPEFPDLSVIHQNAYRAANLVRQLLAFSRKQTLRLQVADVTDRLMDLSLMLNRLIGEKVQLRQELAEDVWPVKVDVGQFEQVITNLVVNARDAMKDGPGGLISIRTRNERRARPAQTPYGAMPAGDYVRIEVEDDGSGIPPEVLAKIFEPFFTTKPVGEGTGLGLSTVWGIVKQTGGYIFVDSTVGVGTTFTIFLPRFDPEREAVGAAQPHEEARGGPSLDGLLAPEPAPERAAGPAARSAAPRTAPDPALLKPRPGAAGPLASPPAAPAAPVAPRAQASDGPPIILLVEDEDPVRALTSRALQNAGYQVLEAESAEAALVVLQDPAQRIDLMLSDVVMPRMDGPTLLREILPERPDLRTLFMSGYTRDAFAEAFETDPPLTVDYGFLEKPFSLGELVDAVRSRMTAE